MCQFEWSVLATLIKNYNFLEFIPLGFVYLETI